jgi:hypothetical protein
LDIREQDNEEKCGNGLLLLLLLKGILRMEIRKIG